MIPYFLTISLKWSPLSSKFLYWSKLAHAGDNNILFEFLFLAIAIEAFVASSRFCSNVDQSLDFWLGLNEGPEDLATFYKQRRRWGPSTTDWVHISTKTIVYNSYFLEIFKQILNFTWSSNKFGEFFIGCNIHPNLSEHLGINRESV